MDFETSRVSISKTTAVLCGVLVALHLPSQFVYRHPMRTESSDRLGAMRPTGNAKRKVE